MEKIILFFIFLSLPFGVFAFEPVQLINPPPNPSAAYCEDLGYEFFIKETPEGQLGMCKFSETEEAPAWAFLRGEEAREHSYCSQEGYEMKLVDDPEKCKGAYKPRHGCLVCVLDDGSEAESSRLMKKEKIEALSAEQKKITQEQTKEPATQKPYFKTFIFLMISLAIIASVVLFFLLRRK